MSERILASNIASDPTGRTSLNFRNTLKPTQRDDGRWVYTLNPDLPDGTAYGVWVTPVTNTVSVGDVVVAVVEFEGDVTTDSPVMVDYTIPLLSVQLSASTWLVASQAQYVNTRFPITFLDGASAVILNAGIFSAEEWPTVSEWYEDKRLELPWFDGATKPKPVRGGGWASL